MIYYENFTLVKLVPRCQTYSISDFKYASHTHYLLLFFDYFKDSNK